VRIRRFNEQLDDVDQGPIDRNNIDPYGEEDWSEKDLVGDFSHEKGTCVHCGSNNIEFGDQELKEDWLIYPYFCEDCNLNGKEVYSITFVINQGMPADNWH